MPPTFEPVTVYGPDAGCPEEFEACFSMEGTSKLVSNIDHLLRYADEAWLLCGNSDGGRDINWDNVGNQ